MTDPLKVNRIFFSIVNEASMLTSPISVKFYLADGWRSSNLKSLQTNLRSAQTYRHVDVYFIAVIFFFIQIYAEKYFLSRPFSIFFFFSQNTLKWMFIKGFLNGRRGGDDNLNKRPWNQQERAIRNDSDVVEDKSKKQKRWLYTVFGP